MDAIISDAADQISEIALNLNGHGYIETQWFLEGLADGLVGERDDNAFFDQLYGRHYRQGFAAASKHNKS